jgi:hypothetical protein
MSFALVAGFRILNLLILRTHPLYIVGPGLRRDSDRSPGLGPALFSLACRLCPEDKEM